MKIEIIAISKSKFSYIEEAQKDYLKRLTQYCNVNIITTKETPIKKGAEEAIRKQEGGKIISMLKNDYITIALDSSGQQYTSQEFSKWIEKIKDFEGGKIQFIIGGPLGLSDEVLANVNSTISFSKMTMTHQLIRIILLEQIYRGFEILKGSGYHK